MGLDIKNNNPLNPPPPTKGDWPKVPQQKEAVPPDPRLGFVDRFLGIDPATKDAAGNTISQAKRASQYYSGFMRMSGYSWAIAIMSGGIAYGLWKLFTPKKHDTHSHSAQPVAK